MAKTTKFGKTFFKEQKKSISKALVLQAKNGEKTIAYLYIFKEENTNVFKRIKFQPTLQRRTRN